MNAHSITSNRLADLVGRTPPSGIELTDPRAAAEAVLAQPPSADLDDLISAYLAAESSGAPDTAGALQAVKDYRPRNLPELYRVIEVLADIETDGGKPCILDDVQGIIAGMLNDATDQAAPEATRRRADLEKQSAAAHVVGANARLFELLAKAEAARRSAEIPDPLDGPQDEDAPSCVAWRQFSDCLSDLAVMPAETLAGARAKADLVLRHSRAMAQGRLTLSDDLPDDLVPAILEDVIRLTGPVCRSPGWIQIAEGFGSNVKVRALMAEADALGLKAEHLACSQYYDREEPHLMPTLHFEEPDGRHHKLTPLGLVPK